MESGSIVANRFPDTVCHSTLPAVPSAFVRCSRYVNCVATEAKVSFATSAARIRGALNENNAAVNGDMLSHGYDWHNSNVTVPSGSCGGAFGAPDVVAVDAVVVAVAVAVFVVVPEAADKVVIPTEVGIADAAVVASVVVVVVLLDTDADDSVFENIADAVDFTVAIVDASIVDTSDFAVVIVDGIAVGIERVDVVTWAVVTFGVSTFRLVVESIVACLVAFNVSAGESAIVDGTGFDDAVDDSCTVLGDSLVEAAVTLTASST